MKKDPFAQRETSRYAHPIPSREHILTHFEEAGTPLSFKRIVKELQLDAGRERDALLRRLKAMVRDNQLLVDRRNTYRLPDYHDLVEGTVVTVRDGTGRIVGDHADLKLNRREMRYVLPGDQVEAIISGTDLRGRSQGKIISVKTTGDQSLIGTCHREGRHSYVRSLNQQRQFRITGTKVSDDQVIRFSPLRDDAGKLNGDATVAEVLGDQLNLEIVTGISLQNDEIPTEFSSAAIDEAEGYGDQVDPGECQHRVDLRDCHFVTIDGADARDFDDAVYCERTGSGGWRLMVAIADVAHYVQPVTPLDREAFIRGNSVYFPQTVIPMLPESLSNGLCSLNPNADRLCLVCDMNVSAKGRLSRFTFYEAVIHSHARLTYDRVAEMLTDVKRGGLEGEQQVLQERLAVLHDVYGALQKARLVRGALDFDTRELGFVLDEQQRLREIYTITRNDAHRLIEECMLCANVAAARFLRLNNLKSLYRVHEGPDSEKLEDLRSFLGQFGVALGGGDIPQPADYQQALQSIKGRTNSQILQTVLLRSLSQAVYQPSNRGHFGLNYAEYAHFTSPIRRYPDLLLHRALKSVIHGPTPSNQVIKSAGREGRRQSDYPYESDDLEVLGDHCSMTERRAEQAVYSVIAWLKCQYMEQHVGDTFAGLITAVTRFGLFVEIGDFSIEGLVHVSNLTSDYYLFDSGRQMLLGERTGASFRLGDQVEVQVVRVLSEERKIDCELVSHRQTADKGSASIKKRRRKQSPRRNRRSTKVRRR